MRRGLVFLILLCALTGLWVLPAHAGTVTIQVQDNKFDPPSGPISVGDTVVFKNTGAAPHNAQASDGSFKIDLISPGEQKSVTITKGGDIPFVCTFHQALGMKSTLTVAAAGAGAGEAPSPGPAPSVAPGQAAASKASAAKPKATQAAPEAPPTQKYFPAIAVLMLLALAPAIGLAYKKMMGSAPAPPPAAPPSE